MASAEFSKTRVAFAFACVYLCWGSTYGAIRISVEHLAPPLVGALRTLFSTILFVFICLLQRRKLRVPRRTAWQLALVGILFMSVNNVLLTWAETMVDSGWASVVIAMIPVLVAVAETVLPGGERLSRRGWAGTLLAAAGIVTLLWPSLHGVARGGRGSNDLRTLAGFAILSVAAVAFAAGSVLSRRFRFREDTFVATAWQIGAAALLNVAIAVPGGTLRTAHFTARGLAAVAYLAVFGTLIGLTAYTYLLQHVPVTKVSTYAFVNPAIAVLLGAVVFHERLSRPEIGGMILILVGVAAVILSRSSAVPLDSDPEFGA